MLFLHLYIAYDLLCEDDQPVDHDSGGKGAQYWRESANALPGAKMRTRLLLSKELVWPVYGTKGSN